jgi:hypothetical protein
MVPGGAHPPPPEGCGASTSWALPRRSPNVDLTPHPFASTNGSPKSPAWGSPKTAGSERTIDLPRVVIAPIAEHLLAFPPLIDQEDPHLEGLVFYGRSGGPVRGTPLGRCGRAHARAPASRACASTGCGTDGASLAYAASRVMKATAARLGQSTRMVDTIYLKLYDEVGRQVADAIDDLERASLKRETDH